jgi:AP endonuclease-2
VKGSDHCPIYVDLHDEIKTESGEKISLKQALGMADAELIERKPPPRLASQFWDEYSGKQKLLSSFFGKGQVGLVMRKTLDHTTSPDTYSTAAENDDTAPSQPRHTTVKTNGSPIIEIDFSDGRIAEPSSSLRTLPFVPLSSSPPRNSSPTPDTELASEPLATRLRSGKRKGSNNATSATFDSSSTPKKKKKAPIPNPEQMKLSNFFAKPKAKQSNVGSESKASRKIEKEYIYVDSGDDDPDYRLALELSQNDSMPMSQDIIASTTLIPATESKTAWSNLFTRMEPPKCTVHGEPAKEFTVNKTGPNKGRSFFVCSR